MPIIITRCCGASTRAASCSSKPTCSACRPSCESIKGEDYDGTPLEEAKTLVKQLRSQFAGRLPNEEKERLRTVEGQLNLEIATRDYRMAEYFDGTKHYGAAHALLRRGDQEISGYGAGHEGPRADGANRRRAGEAAQTAGLVRRLVPGKQRAIARRPHSRAAKRRHAAGCKPPAQIDARE